MGDRELALSRPWVGEARTVGFRPGVDGSNQLSGSGNGVSLKVLR